MQTHKVTSRLYVGSQMTPEMQRWCRSEGITDVINVAQELVDPSFPEGIVIHTLKIGTFDDGKPKNKLWFSPLLTHGLNILGSPQTKLLIHCKAGHNRSPSAAYLCLRGLGLPQILSRSLLPDHTDPKYGPDVDRYLQNANLPSLSRR